MRLRAGRARGRASWTDGHPRRAVAALAAGLVVASLLALVACRSPEGSPSTAPTAASSPAATSPGSPEAPHRSPTPGPDTAGTAPAAAETCTVPASLRGQDLELLGVDERVVALTFDAGASAAGVPSILRTLREREVRATFFLTGQFARTFPVRAARMADEHLVGNHTNTHVDLTTLTDDAVRRQVRNAERSILDVTGEDPRRFFRFPFGARNAHTIALLNGLCYVPFRWTVDTLGWQGTSGGQSVATVVARVLAAVRPGAIVLMHVGANPDDGSTLDADALPRVVRQLRLRGYRLVRLSRIMSWAP